MKNMSKTLLLCATLAFAVTEANASNTIAVNPTNKAALLDGHCGNDEWQAATKIDLPAQASIYLMNDKDYFYLCAKGKAEDHTVLDLYIEHAETGNLHKFHLSAQMGEHVLKGKEWELVTGKWVLNDYAGFWVPYSGLKDTENRKDPIFAKGTHRQVQVSRKKFSGNTWNMMIGVSAINYKGKGAELFYPEKAVDKDKSTWATFSFSD